MTHCLTCAAHNIAKRAQRVVEFALCHFCRLIQQGKPINGVFFCRDLDVDDLCQFGGIVLCLQNGVQHLRGFFTGRNFIVVQHGGQRQACGTVIWIQSQGVSIGLERRRGVAQIEASDVS